MDKLTYRISLIMATFILSVLPIAAQMDGMESDMFKGMRSGDKAAIVAVHFGTSDDAARVLSIERFNTAMKEAFPDYDFREAWTSTRIINKIKEKEIYKQTVDEVLQQLKIDGFTHVLIQPSHIISGIETEHLQYVTRKYSNDFKQIRLSQPLLLEPDDYINVINAELNYIKDKKSVNVLVCHGSRGNANTQYTMLDYMLRDKGLTNWMVATIEGFPTLDNLIKRLKAQPCKKVNLIPFLFVAGDHAHNDINREWKEKLESEGFKVKTIMKGIGQNDEIIKLFVEHAKHTSKFRRYSAVERKMRSAIQGM